MSTVFCPFCGAEISFPLTVNEHGEIDHDPKREVQQGCSCPLLTNRIIDTLQSIALTRMITMMRMVVENSEAR